MSSRQRQFTSLRAHFPLKTVSSVVDLVHRCVDSNYVDLTFLSILLGYIEHSLTCSQPRISTTSSTYTTNYEGHCSSQDGGSGDNSENPEEKDEMPIPWVKWEHIEPIYKKFVSQVKGAVDHHPKKTTREVIKKAVDSIWSNLSRGYYTNKPHLQTLYSFITEDKLDRFGVSYAVIAACQVLELNDVRLALGEDHAWIIFGESGNEQTAEISWRGKGTEDRRGQPVVNVNGWLYLNGYPVICTPAMVFTAFVTTINSSISTTAESEQLAILQHQILWDLYNNGHFSKYPMGVGYLADLEEMTPSPYATKDPGELFKEAIEINKNLYENHHVYPYCFMAGYYFRKGRFKEALQSWADAASVIRRYNYTRDDEEIYKEFLEIANDLIPHMVKVVSAGGCEPGKVSDIPLLQDPECFASLLAFYDGLCGWEEESPTPVLHIGWAKPFVATISKFTSHVRNQAKIRVKDGDSHHRLHIKSDLGHHTEESQSELSDQNTLDGSGKSPKTPDSRVKVKKERETSKSPISPARTPDEIIKSIEDGLKEDGARIEQNLKSGTYDKQKDELDQKTVEKPATDLEAENAPSTSTNPDETEVAGEKSAESENGRKSTEPSSSKSLISESPDNPDSVGAKDDNQRNGQGEKGETVVYLQSQKMIGLKDLLLADKLNTSAIQLQLTAQSQEKDLE